METNGNPVPPRFGIVVTAATELLRLPVPAVERVSYRVQMRDLGADRYTVCIPELDFEGERPELLLQRYPEFLRLSALYVPPIVRRQGLARLLINAALNCAQRVKLPVYLDAAPFADRAVDFPALFALYQSCGFRRFPGHPTAMVWEVPVESGVPA